MAIDLRFLLRRRRNGTQAAPPDHLAAEMAVHENTSTGVNAFYYGHDLDVDGVSAVESHKLFEASDGRLWNDTIGAADGSTAFVGDGSALTAISVDSVAWADVAGKPTTLVGYGIGDLDVAKDGAELHLGTGSAGGPHGVFFHDLGGVGIQNVYRTTPETLHWELGNSSDLMSLDKSGNLTVAGGILGDIDWANVTSTPTTRAGYGITDAAPDVFAFCQYRNTDTTTNLNTASATVIPFGGTTDASDANFTINGGLDRITCNFNGTVSVQAHISQSAAVARSNVGIYIAKNGAQISGLGLSGYIRAASGHNESSAHMTATFTVSSGDYIEVFGQQQALAGTVTQIDGGSQVTVERRA